MAIAESKQVPQHPHWYEDLPAIDAPADRIPKMVHGDINSVDPNYLEVSRASTLMRGVGILFGAFGLGVLIFVLYMYRFFFPLEPDLIAPFIIVSLGILGLCFGIFLLFKIDLSIPRDRPVRFNASRQKIYVYEHVFSWNPFVKWPIKIKIFDWSNIQAELHRQAGFNGKAYIQRFSLWLVSYKPGTNEVVDRFELKGNHPTRAELYDTWSYCRHYMEHGVESLPVYSPRRQGVSFRRSLFEYIRFLDPTEEGREERAQMKASEWIFNSIITLLVFWLLIPWGIGHYIAMRFAPDVKWPPEVDAESRSS